MSHFGDDSFMPAHASINHNNLSLLKFAFRCHHIQLEFGLYEFQGKGQKSGLKLLAWLKDLGANYGCILELITVAM